MSMKKLNNFMDIIKAAKTKWQEFRLERAVMKETKNQKETQEERSKNGKNFENELEAAKTRLSKSLKSEPSVEVKKDDKGNKEITVNNATAPVVNGIKSIKELVKFKK